MLLLSFLPFTPFSFHVPDASVTLVSADGAEEGSPLSKFSMNLSSAKAYATTANIISNVVSFLIVVCFEVSNLAAKVQIDEKNAK